MRSRLAALDACTLAREPDTLLVARKDGDLVEPFICISGDGSVIGFCGHVDLGQGIRTALGQIVAEELDVPVARVEMVLGDTGRAPDQGPTIASDSIQNSARPLRKAAAQARAALIALAADRLQVPADSLSSDNGTISCRQIDARVDYAELVRGRHIVLPLDENHPVKAPSEYRVVGRPQPRVDIPAKVSGEITFIHDMRVAGMLHGRVVRPPYGGVDHGPFVGTSLISVDEASIAHIGGIVAVVVEGDFIGIVTEREEQAEAAAAALKATWKDVPELRSLDDLAAALSANPCTSRRLQDKGDVERALAEADRRLPRRYVWPYQLHGSIGPSCGVADVRSDGVTIWSGTQNPYPLRADIAQLLNLPPEAIEIVRMEAAGCYGRNCADDVCADAALLSRAVGAPVRVQLTREQEHIWEPKGAAQLIEIDGGLDAAGEVTAYDFQSRYPSNGAPTLALLLTGRIPPIAETWEMGDRTSVAPYDYANMRVTVHDMPPIVRASWLRGVSALPNSFAHESWIDEAAAEAQVDPIEYRLRYLKDPRVRDLVLQTAEQSGWTPHNRWGSHGSDGDILYGRGFAYAHYVHSSFPGYGAAWSAWVADVEVNRQTGEVAVTRIVNGHDAGMMINPAGVQHQIHGNVIQSVSRATREQVTFAQGMPAQREWGGYSLLPFTQLPRIDTRMIDRPDQPPLGAGESASVPSAAAIANAIYDACGVRFREPPFTADKVREALGVTMLAAAAVAPTRRRVRPWRTIFAGVSLSLAGLIGAALPWRAAIAPIDRPLPNLYSAQTIERGRQLSAIGDCAICHTAPGGARLAGGYAIESPFGTIYGANITPDPETGIGSWSYAAFERAMRRGIARDGRHLYPAFPYTHFTKASDADLEALYAYLMAQPAVRHNPPATRLSFPFNLRFTLAGWNALFLKEGPITSMPDRDAQWNRGRYLVDGLGHCSACHSPRNALGAEMGSRTYLAGGEADGWEAPALGERSPSALRWSEADYYQYLRYGYAPRHGSAAGPMTPVVAELRDVADADVRAMAHYLASLDSREDVGTADALIAASNAAIVATPDTPGARLYDGACAVCHTGVERRDLFGIRPQLALNTNVRSDRPDNLIRVILEGIATPAAGMHGTMPAFHGHINDRQLADLVRYIRATFAPDRQPWADIEHSIAQAREGLRKH